MITLLIWICLFPFLKYAILADLNLYYCAVLVNHDTLYKDCLNSKKTIPEYHEERCKEMIKDGEECNRLYRRISRETTTTLAFRHTVSQNQNRKKVNRNRRNNSKFSSKENNKYSQDKSKSYKNDEKTKGKRYPKEIIRRINRCSFQKYTMSFLKCLTG
ncbi:uncharacterized protein [Drosophila tropicalis]|uniref:uncharacterized protein isoform X1 n=1 Tax=Drosophila tropicalis TaxID=46794 RepID=UPI0035ABEDEB